MNIIGKYQLKHQLGRGSFGQVWLAHDLVLNAEKAIKIIECDGGYNDIERKLKEARILHDLSHNNIVCVNEANIFEFSPNKKIILIDMEYLPMGSLEDNMFNLSISQILKYITDCLFALEHTHMRNILHRDIKPANIMLCNYGAKLSDFGLATIVSTNMTGSDKGYISHLAPEIFSEKSTTKLTDIYAMGITLYRLLNYIKDWKGIFRNTPNINHILLSGELIDKIGFKRFLPRKLNKIVKKACERDPLNRYQTAIEFRQDIQKLKIKIDWKFKDDYFFVGVENKDEFSIELVSSKNPTYYVEVKKNKRRVNKDCLNFVRREEAENYFFSFISKNMFY